MDQLLDHPGEGFRPGLIWCFLSKYIPFYQNLSKPPLNKQDCFRLLLKKHHIKEQAIEPEFMGYEQYVDGLLAELQRIMIGNGA